MPNLPFRTHQTWLSDLDLALLDRCFYLYGSFCLRNLRSFINPLAFEQIQRDFDVAESQMKKRFEIMQERGVFDVELKRGEPYFRFSHKAGELWSTERTPVWEHFFRFFPAQAIPWGESQESRVIQYRSLSDKVIEDLFSVSPWTFKSIRIDLHHREKSLLLSWEEFPKFYCGIGYVELDSPLEPKPQALVEAKRSWWFGVGQLQKFLSPRNPMENKQL